MSESRESTPETHPTYGVHLSDVAIVGIIDGLLPQCIVLSITPLEQGKSFNNRIYFVKIHVPKDSSFPGLKDDCTNELVLKVNGRFFNLSKSRNEASCLTLLNAYAPKVPSPYVLAWADVDNTVVHRLNSQGVPERKTLRSNPGLAEGQRPLWILMTTVPGTSLSNFKPSDRELQDIGRQLAAIVCEWREKLPIWTTAGNLDCKPTSETRQKVSSLQNGSVQQSQGSLTINSLHIFPSPTLPAYDAHFAHPLTTHQAYYTLRLTTRLQKLRALPIFATNTYLISPLEGFLTTTLPTLSLCHQNGRFHFTHNDLCPRNLLIGRNPWRITGIVDFEFAGFFPELDDFVNDAMDNEGEWPVVLYEAFLGRLEEYGMRTPRKGVEERVWEEAKMFARLEENVAPWWLENVKEGEGEGVREELEKAGKTVIETIKALSRSSQI